MLPMHAPAAPSADVQRHAALTLCLEAAPAGGVKLEQAVAVGAPERVAWPELHVMDEADAWLSALSTDGCNCACSGGCSARAGWLPLVPPALTSVG